MKKFLIINLMSICVAMSSKAQIVQNTWKPLGPFAIHKKTGETAAPGLGVMRTVEVSTDNPNRILMGGMSSGIWQSLDKGKTWKYVTRELPVENVKKIEVARSNSNIWYAATNAGILVSENGGNSWHFTSLNIKQKAAAGHKRLWNDDQTLISVSPQQPKTVIASAADTLFKTTDGGQKWKKSLVGFQTQFIQFHPTNGQIVYVGGAYKKQAQGFVFLRSTNAGESFEEISSGLPDPTKLTQLHDITAAVTPAAPDHLYMMIFGNGQVPTTVKKEIKSQMMGAFMVSKDKGKTFEPVKQANNYRKIDDNYSLFHMYSADEDKEQYDFDYKDSSYWQGSFQQVGWATGFGISNHNAATMVVAGSGAALSTNGGQSWNILRKQGQYHIHGDIQSIKIVGNDVWLANDGGLNYVNLNDRIPVRMEGYSGQDLWGFSTSFKSEIMAVGVDHSGTMIFDEKLYGKEWYHYGGGDAMTATVNPFDDRFVYATPYTHYVIQRPLNLRDEPIAINSPINFGYIPNRNLEFHPNLVYTAYGIDEDKSHWSFDTCRVVMTSNNLQTVDTLLEFPFKAYGKRVRISVADPNYLYAICQKPSKVYRSSNAGKTWTEITPKIDAAIKLGFNDIGISDKDPQRIYLAVAGVQNVVKMLYSTNGGQSWNDYHSAELPEAEIITLTMQRGTNDGIYLGCYPGVYYRNLTMKTWATVAKNLPHTPVNFIFLNYDKAKIRIGTYRGIWETNLYEDFEPRALITMNKTKLPSGNSNESKVFFYDHSALKGGGAKWQWEFPGSIQKTSTDENPIIDYEATKPGKYSVRLTVTDAKGRKSSTELKDYIEVIHNAPWNLRERKLETRDEVEYRKKK